MKLIVHYSYDAGNGPGMTVAEFEQFRSEVRQRTLLLLDEQFPGITLDKPSLELSPGAPMRGGDFRSPASTGADGVPVGGSLVAPSESLMHETFGVRKVGKSGV